MFQCCTRVLRDNKYNHSTVENAKENKTKSIIKIVEAGIVDIRYGIVDSGVITGGDLDVVSPPMTYKYYVIIFFSVCVNLYM